MQQFVFAALFGAALVSPALAAEGLPVPGSNVKFPAVVTVQHGQQTVTLKATGTALRTRAIFSVYAIASYLQDGNTAKTADDVARAEAVKMMYIVMERTVSGKDFIDAVKTAVGKSHPADKFAAEFTQLNEVLGDKSAAKGDHVSLTYLPGTGLRVQIIGKADLTVKGAEFGRAVWEVYLGAKPIDDGMKAGLVSQLGK